MNLTQSKHITILNDNLGEHDDRQTGDWWNPKSRII